MGEEWDRYGTSTGQVQDKYETCTEQAWGSTGPVWDRYRTGMEQVQDKYGAGIGQVQDNSVMGMGYVQGFLSVDLP